MVGIALAVGQRLSKVRPRALEAAEHAVKPPARFARQTARRPRFISPRAAQRTAVQTAARDFRLTDPAVRADRYLLRARLPRIAMSVGLTVVEHIILAVCLDDRAVRIAGEVRRVLNARYAAQPDVAYGNERAAEREVPVGAVAHRVAQLVPEKRRIDKVILLPDLPHARRLEELVPLVIRACGIVLAARYVFRRQSDRQHIAFELGHHRAAAALLTAENDIERKPDGAEPRIQINVVALDVNAGIELKPAARFAAEQRAVGVMHEAVKLILSRRFVAHGDAHPPGERKRVIQIIPPVRSAAHVGRIHMQPPAAVIRILRLAVYHALAAPVGQIALGRAPTHVVVHTERLAAETVVTAVKIYPVAELVRLAVRDVLPARQERIECLRFHIAIISHPPRFVNPGAEKRHVAAQFSADKLFLTFL